MSLKGSPVSSKLLICVENWNFNVIGSNPADTRRHEHVHSIQVQRWSCFVDKASSRSRV